MNATYEHNEDDGYEAVHLRDDSGLFLSIMRGLEDNDSDVELGQDRYCLVEPDGAVVYGGIDDWHRDSPTTGRMRLTDVAEELLHQPGLVIELPEDEMKLLDDHLTRWLREEADRPHGSGHE